MQEGTEKGVISGEREREREGKVERMRRAVRREEKRRETMWPLVQPRQKAVELAGG